MPIFKQSDRINLIGTQSLPTLRLSILYFRWVKPINNDRKNIGYVVRTTRRTNSPKKCGTKNIGKKMLLSTNSIKRLRLTYRK